MEKGKSIWDLWIEQALARLESHKMFAPLRPMQLPGVNLEESEVEAAQTMPNDDEYETSQRLQPWDRLSIQISLPDSFFKRLLTGGELIRKNELADYKVNPEQEQFRKLLLFAGNDFLALSRHPAIAKATAKAAAEHGTGPRGSPLICGYTNYHKALESSLAKLKKKEACLLTSSGFAANMAVMVAIGSLAPLLSVGKRPTKEEKIAIFSDSLNHASIVDGIKLAERHGGAQHFVYKHNDMFHLDQLLTHCKLQRKVVVTDSLFSMDGDFAPMVELVQLRKKHGFLFVVDDAHGTFVWGKNGGGVPEEFNCEYDVDISVGTLSKAAGSLGGFITCSKTWKQFFQSRGRSFIFSTIAPVPLTAASYASVVVSRKEPWRRMEIRKRMKEFQALTGIPVTSQIVSVIVGSNERTISTSWELLKAGFYVVPVGPPAVPPNSARLRITLTAAHTSEDIKRLVKILSDHISFSDINNYSSELYARL
ncbi:Aminotransferase, class I/classII [Corchorus olitorius]|uniref:Aminotransferase, class I/classII n=1 Tax=Corchorus olitorius TaxID=93759 RepID=A0A1R3JTW1_9ROSI|nr:Aminotransferase, class I/classII [Corchorus olitorius]